MTWKDQVIVITGGSSGLGLELARRLRDAGAKLALIARDPAKLEAVRSELAARPGAALAAYSCDVSDFEAVQATFKKISDDLGSPDVLFLSAGLLAENPAIKESLDTFRRLMETNYFGVLHCVKAALPGFYSRRAGRIVVVSSMAGLMGVYGYSPYCSTKFALSGLCEVLRQEFKLDGISVHIVHPPEFDSPMVDSLNQYRSPENRFLVQTAPVLSVEQVAAEILAGVDRGAFRIIPGFQSRMLDRLNRWAPWLGRAIVDYQLRRCRKSSRP